MSFKGGIKMSMTELDKKAINAGGKYAAEVLAFRDKALKRRKNVLKKHDDLFRFSAQSLSGKPLDSKFEESFIFEEVASKGVLIAEGDSWFDYPFYDILRYLEDEHGYDVESVAHKGDPVEAMAYGLGQLEELTRRIEKVMRRGTTPKAILLSGGGNDIAGSQFGMLLNHYRSDMPHLNEQIVSGVIDNRIRTAYVTILSAVTDVCRKRIGNPIPIIIHGYDYPVPDGRGYLGGFWVLPGPWLEPGFREKGYEELSLRVSITQELIIRFNKMLKNVSSLLQHVKYIDLQNTLSIDLVRNKYKEMWGNELHPTEKGFEKVAGLFADVLKTL
jgi:hypothetical protein